MNKIKSNEDLLQLLADCAECLNDCLIRIYPEEFEQKYIDEADERFYKHHGTIARIASLVERINATCHEKGDDCE